MKLLVLLLFMFSGVAAFGLNETQPVVKTFAEAGKAGISIDEIDARYQDALHAEAEKGLFNEKSDVFISAYSSFLSGHARYLNENGFFWSGQTRIFSRIYFNSDGHAEYFFINEQQAGLDENELKTFLNLTASFLKQHKIDIQGDVPFAQCSPVVYQNVLAPSHARE